MGEPDSKLLLALLEQFPIIEYTVYGFIATCGAVTRYLWDCLRDVSEFSFARFLAFIVLGIFIGNLVGNFLPKDYGHRDGVLLLTGFIVKELLEIIESKGAAGVMKFLRLAPVNEKKEDDNNGDTPNQRDENNV